MHSAHVASFLAALLTSPTPPDGEGSIPTTTVALLQDEPCYQEDGSFCKWVYDVSGENEDLATATSWVVGTPLTILVIVVGAWIAAHLARRGIARGIPKVVAQREARTRQLREFGIAMPSRVDVGEADSRIQTRTAAITAVLISAVSVTIWTIAALMVIATIGIQIGPLLAGAGIAGIALGFGAQKLVQDCIAGFFMLVEDQFGIGDVVDTGHATGTVESISLRTTVLRSVDGTVWHVPNGEMQRVGNLSQRYSMAVVDVDVAYQTELKRARQLVGRAAHEVCRHPEHREKVLEQPKVLGVEKLGSDGITLRLTVQVRPGEQWALQRALREHIKLVFDREGVEIPFPQRVVWQRDEGEPTPSHAPTASEVPPATKIFEMGEDESLDNG